MNGVGEGRYIIDYWRFFLMKVRFHLPGLRSNFPLNMLLVNMIEQEPSYFREGLEIASFFGEFPTSLWNGGRFPGPGDQCGTDYIRGVLHAVNEKGIPVRFTYTSPLITEEDLDDPYCNFCLKEADNGLNEVIVVSPILEDYIRKNYPRFKITSSTCKEIKDMQVLNQELKKDYHIVVLDYNLNNKWDLLNQIEDKERCELLANCCCVPNCPRRGEHYRFMSRQERIELANRKRPPQEQEKLPTWFCEYGKYTTLDRIRSYETHISPDDIWNKYAPMGFTNFKLEGRTANLFILIEQYAYYFAKPEHRDMVRFLLTTNLESYHVISVNHPRRENWP